MNTNWLSIRHEWSNKKIENYRLQHNLNQSVFFWMYFPSYFIPKINIWKVKGLKLKKMIFFRCLYLFLKFIFLLIFFWILQHLFNLYMFWSDLCSKCTKVRTLWKRKNFFDLLTSLCIPGHLFLNISYEISTFYIFWYIKICVILISMK